MSGFSRFTQQITRHQIILAVALVMLAVPALFSTTVGQAQTKKSTKATPAPKGKATPDKKRETPTKSAKTPAKSDAKSKTEPKSNSKSSAANKSNQKSTGRNSKDSTNKSSRETAKTKGKADDRSTKAADSRNKKTTAATNKTTALKNTSSKSKAVTEKDSKRTTAAKTPAKPNSRPSETVENKPKPVPIRTAARTPEFAPVIVTSVGAPVKSQATTGAPTLSNLKVGTILRVTDKNPLWYKVQVYSDGRRFEGWVAANAASDIGSFERGELYRQIAERNYRAEMDFSAAAELYEFLSGVGSEVSGSGTAPEIELRRLLALRTALRGIPVDRQHEQPYGEFLRANEREIVYSEPAGEWHVAANRFWELHTKYRTSNLAETIAWEAANNPLPGECEGYVNCYLFDMRMRFGEYLSRHPNGRHSIEALQRINERLAPVVADLPNKSVYTGPTEEAERVELNNLIAELRTIIMRVPSNEKEKTLQQIKQLTAAFK